MQQTACSKGAHRRLTLLVSGGVALGLASWTYGQCKNDCGAGNVAEDEPCLVDLDEDTTNGGCNSDPNVFGSARCGDIICGTASTYDIDTDGDGIADTDARDTDWYLLDAAELALADVDGNGVVQIQAFLTSEFDGVTFIVSLGDPICSTTDIIGQTGFSAAGCAGGDPAVGTLILADHPNGVAVFVAPGNADGTPIFDGFECGLGANDYILVIECIELETVCAPGSGPCDEPNGTPGCEDRDCCVLVCDIDLGDPLCCIFGWNDNCANLALELCGGGCNACGDVACGSCDVDNGSPFCDDAACCDLVCAVDPFCCDVTWDDICAGEAVDICVCKPGDEPRNNDCANAIPVSEGVFAYSTLCATHDGPTEPTQFDCDDKVGAAPGVGLEVWFDYTPSFSGLARVYTCEQADYNTALAVYDGCACPAPDADIIDCNDEGLTCPPLDTGSEVVFPAIAGNCYKIAVGGRYGFSGTGTLTIELTRIPGPCVDGVGNCLQANGSPGCDQFDCCFDICEVNPDCCDVDWDQACADLAAGTCSPLPCAPIDTSGANVIEPEACGEDTNAGCNNVPTDLTDIDPSMFTDIVSGDVIAGTAWADGGARDTDWYLINVTAEDDADGDGMVDIHYNILGELPVVSFALEDPGSDCGDDVDIVGTVAYSQSCVQVGFGVVTVAAPGTYYIFAGTGNEGGGGIFDGYPCPPPGVGVFGNQYLLCVTVVDDGQPAVTDCPPAAPPCPADFDLSGAVDVKDLLFLLGAWGPCPKQGDCPADFDLSGAVDVKDLLFLLGAWGPC